MQELVQARILILTGRESPVVIVGRQQNYAKTTKEKLNKPDLIELIEQAKRGKQSAQTSLMNLLWDKVYFFVLKKIRNKTDAEDITILTFTKVFQKLKLYNEDFEFITWVYAIAKNTMIDHIRKSSDLNVSINDEFTQIELKAAIPSPEQNLIIKQSNSQLMKAISELPETYKQVIVLRYLDGLTYKQISKKLDLSMSNVKVRILRGRKLLVDMINP